MLALLRELSRRACGEPERDYERDDGDADSDDEGGMETARESFPELAPDLRFRDFIVDLNPFLFQGEVEGFLTRLSGTSLANVSSGGGQVPSFLVEPR